MNRFQALSATLAAGAIAAACASNPPPPPAPVAAPAPAPVERSVNAVPETRAPATTRPAAPVTRSGPGAGTLDDFRVNVGERVFFDLDQYTLDVDDRTILERQAAWLQRYPDVRVLVAGNADERGTREYNLALGARRANTVKDYLVQLGVGTNRIDTVSYGKERPIAAGNNPEAWARNRNAHTQVSGAAGA